MFLLDSRFRGNDVVLESIHITTGIAITAVQAMASIPIIYCKNRQKQGRFCRSL
jgi:hypothetical protein